MNNPLVTCIVLSYQRFEYLYEAIDSIIQQDYTNIELIVADDASDEFPEYAIRAFVETNKKSNLKRIIIYSNQHNLGTVKNYNNAIKMGQGQYYISLSGDDVFYDNTVMSRIVKRFEDLGSDILVCRRLRCTADKLKPIRLMPNSSYLPLIKRLNTPEKQYRALVLGRFYEMASGSVTYFTKNHFDKWGYFDESYVLWEDGPFYAQYTRAGNIIHTAYDIISIRYRDDGVSNRRIHPLMKKDRLSFLMAECLANSTQLSKMDQRTIAFAYEWAYKEEYRSTTFDNTKILVKYFDSAFHKLFHKLFLKMINSIEKYLNFRGQ